MNATLREIDAALRDARARESSLLSRIASLEEQLGAIDLASPLRPVAEGTERSIFLVHCAFDHRVRDPSGSFEDRHATSWGTAFCVTADGHLVTNKHLIEPWKFDADLSALVAWGDAEIDESSVEIVAWPAGVRCLDAAGKADPSTGYSTSAGEGVGNLRLVAKATDVFEEHVTRLSGLPVRHRIHRLDENDLAILRLEGESFVPLPCRTESSVAAAAGSADPRRDSTERLDPVMAIGFPRGGRGLDRQRAEPSFATGVVRRVGSSIYTTVPMTSGNSGGPLLDETGHVIGVATCVFGESESVAVHIAAALALLEGKPEPTTAVASPASIEVDVLDPPLASR